MDIYIRRAPRNITGKGFFDLTHRQTCYRHWDRGVEVSRSLRGEGQRALVVGQMDFVIGVLVLLSRCYVYLSITYCPGIAGVGVGTGVAKNEMCFPVLIGKEHCMGMTHRCEDRGECGGTSSPTEEGYQNNQPCDCLYAVSPHHSRFLEPNSTVKVTASQEECGHR